MLRLASPKVFIYSLLHFIGAEMLVLYPADQPRVMNKCLQLETNQLHASLSLCNGKHLQAGKKPLIKW